MKFSPLLHFFLFVILFKKKQTHKQRAIDKKKRINCRNRTTAINLTLDVDIAYQRSNMSS